MKEFFEVKSRREVDWDSESLLPEKLYVVVVETGDTSYPIATLSPSRGEAGWCTDSGCPGYGLPLELAIEIARRYNEFKESK